MAGIEDLDFELDTSELGGGDEEADAEPAAPKTLTTTVSSDDVANENENTGEGDEESELLTALAAEDEEGQHQNEEEQEQIDGGEEQEEGELEHEDFNISGGDEEAGAENPLGEQEGEDGEIMDEDANNSQELTPDHNDSRSHEKSQDSFPDTEDQDQEQEESINMNILTLDPDQSQNNESSRREEPAVNPLAGTTVLDDGDGLEDSGNVLGISMVDDDEIAEVNPADFMDIDVEKVIGGNGKEEGEIDDEKEAGGDVSEKGKATGEGEENKKSSEKEDGEEEDKKSSEKEKVEKKVSEIVDIADEEDEEEGSMPMIRMNSSIFESQADEDEDEDGEQNNMNESSMDPEMLEGMMEFEMDEGEGGEGSTILQGILKKKKSTSSSGDEPVRRVLPRRAAAQAAANTIKEISNLELTEPSDNDPEFSLNSGNIVSYTGATGSSIASNSGSDSDRHRCHHCKKMGNSLIVVRQYGTDIHLCSNSCFNSFRNPDPTKRPFPCAKCGILNRDSDGGTVLYWETMNFCSDLCVGNFQLEIGSKCSTCVKRVAWASLGKYCVRFGSDIRQFCSAQCLESYKKNARVCFHCQLDIKKLGNVVMVNIPSKNSPKEFCGQDCVEMYIEKHHNSPTRVKPIVTINCCICAAYKLVDKELVVAPKTFPVCGEPCWQKLLKSHNIQKANKCETCTKYINMEHIKPAFYVATEKKAYGFCSATCKNVFVLNHRQILSCTNCKVKKYNYDLIQSVTGPVVNFAVCSLNCLPKPSQYISNLKETVTNSSGGDPSMPIISSVTSMSTNQQNGTSSGDDLGIQISSVASLADVNSIGLERSDLLNGATFRFTDTGSGLTLRQVTEDDIIEIHDEDSNTTTHMNGVGGRYDDDDDPGDEEIVDHVSITDRRWTKSDIAIVYGKKPCVMVNKCTSVRPRRITKDVQSNEEELWEMPRVDMTIPPNEKLIYVPIPVPYPVFLPCPFYPFTQPVPMPLPLGVPIPIPIPVDLKLLEKEKEKEGGNRKEAAADPGAEISVETEQTAAAAATTTSEVSVLSPIPVTTEDNSSVIEAMDES